jgi:hypothetical protein
VISGLEIRIGTQIYPLSRVQDIDFEVEGYDGMIGKRLSSPEEGQINGMHNYLRFIVDGQKQVCQFYLAGPSAVQQLGLLFRGFYEKGTPFVERNGPYRTFLFKTVLTDEELRDMKIGAGYA